MHKTNNEVLQEMPLMPITLIQLPQTMFNLICTSP